MAETPVLQQNEISPAINGDKLLKDSQDREFDRLLLSLESDRYTLFDLQDIVIQIGNNNPKAQPYINEFIASRTTQLQQVLMQNRPGKTETQIKEKPSLTISQERQNQLVKSGETEIKSKEQELKQLEQKLIQINLISQVASMYKEYLQSIMEAIKVKFLTNKPERYKDQIDTISKQVEYLKNLEIYLSTLKNYDELKNLNLTDLVNKMIVSEEKLSQTGFLDQPLGNSLLYHEATVDGVNEGYEDIKKMLLTPNLTREKAEEIKLKIFSKIRRFDVLGTDDNGLVLDSSDAISTRVIPNVLQNKDLRKRPDINTTFSLLEGLGNNKQDLFNSLKGGKENLKIFLINSKVLDKLGFRTSNDKNDFVDDLYKNLKENLNKINEVQIKKDFETETKNRFDYLLARTPENQKSKILKDRETALQDDNLLAGVELLKQEAIFTLFEKTVMNRVLENNATYVRNTGFKDTAINLYRDIEGIGDKISDKTFNNISIFTKTLVEQIALMYVAGIVGGFAIKGASYGELVASLPTTGVSLKNTTMLASSLSYESLIVYLSYTGANGLVNEKEAHQLFDKLNNYDYIRNIIFLGVLKNIPIDSMKSTVDPSSKLFNESKRILIDTGALLGTDIIIRASLGELMGKEGIPTDVDGNYTWEKGLEFATDELKSIIPLIIGLRQAERSIGKLFENGNKPKITVTATQDEFIINIEGLKKEIRTLRQQRNTLRNKGKSTREVSEKLADKKREYKTVRDETSENTMSATSNKKDENITPVLQNNSPVKPKDENSRQKDNNTANDKVNLNTGEKTIQEMLKGNVESVMKGFDLSRQSLSRSFEELLSKGGDKQKAEELISQEVDVRVKQLEKDGVKIDPVEGELFIARFKEERIAEFEQLIKIKEQGGQIPENMKVSYKGREWDLKLRDVNKMNEYFERYVKKENKTEEQENNLKNNN